MEKTKVCIYARVSTQGQEYDRQISEHGNMPKEWAMR